jgi:hypothetical protein
MVQKKASFLLAYVVQKKARAITSRFSSVLMKPLARVYGSKEGEGEYPRGGFRVTEKDGLRLPISLRITCIGLSKANRSNRPSPRCYAAQGFESSRSQFPFDQTDQFEINCLLEYPLFLKLLLDNISFPDTYHSLPNHSIVPTRDKAGENPQSW